MNIPQLHTEAIKSGKIFPFVWTKDEVALNWDLIEDMVQASVDHSHGTVTLPQIKAMLLDGAAHAMGTQRGEEVIAVAVAHKVEYATFNAVRIIAMAGHELKEMMRFSHVLEEYAVSMECIELEGWCRPALVRLMRRFGWRTKFTIVVFDLRRKLQ